MADEQRSYGKRSNDEYGEVSSTTTKENGNQSESYVPVKRRRLNDNAFQWMPDVSIVDGDDFLYDAEEVRRAAAAAEEEDGGGDRPTSNNDEEKFEDEYDASFDVPEFVVTLNSLEDGTEESPLEGNEEVIDFNEHEEREAAALDVQGFDEQFRSRGAWREKCRYYPHCIQGDACLYYHPTVKCKAFPNCKFGDSCLYDHPECKYKGMCTGHSCNYWHSGSKTPIYTTVRNFNQPLGFTSQLCKYYDNCLNPNCAYQHPADKVVQMCPYDPHCMNKACTYSHTSLSRVETFDMNQFKWIRPKDSENTGC